MRCGQLTLIILVTINLFSFTLACKGCIDLDEYNFEKILRKFKAVLVKFDVAYPYGEKHDLFSEISKEITGVPDLILAQVGIKDYGEKDNEDLGKKYGINSKDELPTLRLFIEGKAEPLSLPKEIEWNQETIKTFIRDNTGLYIGLAGCLETFDKLAKEFISSSHKEDILKKALKIFNSIKTERDKTTANIYTKYMNKIIEKDLSFINHEDARLKKLLKESKLNEKKKTELSLKVNILKSFKPPKVEL